MVIELRVVQFWSEIILVISNRTRAVRSFDFEITRMISDQIALHSVQLPLLTYRIQRINGTLMVRKIPAKFSFLFSSVARCQHQIWIVETTEG